MDPAENPIDSAACPAVDASPASVCPRCGDGFRCGATSPQACPCESIRLTPERLSELRARYVGCLCLRCLQACAAVGPDAWGPSTRD